MRIVWTENIDWKTWIGKHGLENIDWKIWIGKYELENMD